MRRESMKILFMFTIILLSCSPAKAQVTIGSDGVPNAGALLDLKQRINDEANADKGLNFPRVSLEAANRLEPCATTNATNRTSHRGLVVYHTNNAVMTEGLYYWNGGSWRRLVDEIPPAPVIVSTQRGLTAATTIGSSVDYSLTTSIDQCNGNVVTLPFETITIRDEAFYAFNVRFFGSYRHIASGTNFLTQGPFVWINLVVNGTIVDSQEYYLPCESPAVGSIHRVTITSTLSGRCPANAAVEISFQLRSNHTHSADRTGGVIILSNSNNIYPAAENWAGRNSLIFWKL